MTGLSFLTSPCAGLEGGQRHTCAGTRRCGSKVQAVHRGVGQLLSRYTAGQVPKAFKLIPAPEQLGRKFCSSRIRRIGRPRRCLRRRGCSHPT